MQDRLSKSYVESFLEIDKEYSEIKNLKGGPQTEFQRTKSYEDWLKILVHTSTYYILHPHTTYTSSAMHRGVNPSPTLEGWSEANETN